MLHIGTGSGLLFLREEVFSATGGIGRKIVWEESRPAPQKTDMGGGGIGVHEGSQMAFSLFPVSRCRTIAVIDDHQ